jgi:hypothetical protein
LNFWRKWCKNNVKGAKNVTKMQREAKDEAKITQKQDWSKCEAENDLKI